MIMIFHGGYKLLINADNLVRSSMYQNGCWGEVTEQEKGTF